jgi:uncharacterized membrane protein
VKNMNISISRLVILVLGIICLIAGVFFGIEAMRETDWIKGIFALVGIAVGFALVSGKGINVSA